MNPPLFNTRPDGSVVVISEQTVNCKGCGKASAIFVRRLDGNRCATCDGRRP